MRMTRSSWGCQKDITHHNTWHINKSKLLKTNHCFCANNCWATLSSETLTLWLWKWSDPRRQVCRLRALWGSNRDAPCLDRLVIRSSDFGFYRSQMISVKREILIDDDSLRLNAMQGHGLEDADMLICLRVNGDLVENAELSKVNQPQIPQAYQCNLLEKCCYTSGRSWHANPFPNPNCNKLEKTQTSLYRSNMFWTKSELQNFEKLKRASTCCLRSKILDSGEKTRPQASFPSK